MAEPTMDEVVNVEEELQACDICGRTFLPGPLEKHTRICQRNATKKRKVFDSQKQRVEGTELASFQPTTYIKKQSASVFDSPKKPSKWKEKHLELVNAIRAARNVNVTVEMTSSSTTLNNPKIATSGADRCPSCDRQFGPRAYDRHVEWCKERNSRVQKSPADVLLAKERLAARTKYKVPLPIKSKRAIIKEKYSPTLGNRTDSFSSIKSGSCTNLERTLSSNKYKSFQKKQEVTAYDHGDGTDTLLVDEKATKKHDKERKTLPEIKPALDPKSPRTSRLLILKQKINTVEVNTNIEGMTVSHLSNNPEKETKRLVTWKDTVKSENADSRNKNLKKLGNNFVPENEKISVTNLQFESKPCSVLTAMIEESEKDIRKARNGIYETSLQKKSKSISDQDNCKGLLSTKAIRSLLQPKYTRLPVRKLKNIHTFTSQINFSSGKKTSAESLGGEDSQSSTSLQSLLNPEAENDTTCNYNELTLTSNEEDVENYSKLPIRKSKQRHSFPPRIPMSKSFSKTLIEEGVQSKEELGNLQNPNLNSKLPESSENYTKLKHRHNLSSRTKVREPESVLDYSKSSCSIVQNDEELGNTSKLPIRKLSFASKVCHKSASDTSVEDSSLSNTNADLETDSNDSKLSLSPLVENKEKESNSRLPVRKSKDSSNSQKARSKIRVSAPDADDLNYDVRHAETSSLNEAQKTVTLTESTTSNSVSFLSQDFETDYSKNSASEMNLNFKISTETFSLSVPEDSEVSYKHLYSGGQLDSNNLYQAAKRMCETERYTNESGSCDEFKNVGDKSQNTDKENEESKDSDEGETNHYKFDNDNIEEFAKLDCDPMDKTDCAECDSKATLHSNNTFFLCKSKENQFELDSMKCDESDIWNMALSLARIEQSKRNCSSAVYVQSRESESDFVTYTETDLDKFGSFDCDGELSVLEKTNSNFDCVPAKRRKLIDKPSATTLPLDIDSDNSFSNEENRLKLTNSGESFGSYTSLTDEKLIELKLPKSHRKISPRLLAIINLIKNDQSSFKNQESKNLVTLSKEDCRKLFELDPAVVKDMDKVLPNVERKKPSKTVKPPDEERLSLPPISKIPINQISPNKSVNESRKILTPTLPEIVPKSFVSSKSGLDKKRPVNTIKRTVSIRESPNKPNLKSKQDVEHYFTQQEKKSNHPKTDQSKHPEGLRESEDPKSEDLFSIDDEMYEEYKKYEELYLKEKQLQNQNTEVPLTELVEYDELELINSCSISKPNADSAYNSLNRSNPKIRSKLNKLNPLDYQKPHVTPDGSPSSSSSETGAVTKTKKRIPKFCHECGNKYPIESAKFCVECGAKRLTL